MASVHRELALDAPVEQVWSAIRDFGAVHERVAPGFVVACVVDGDVRDVTFSNGTTAREILVDLDDEKRRLVYAVKSERVRHYNAALHVIAEDGRRSRLDWTVDVLPDEVAGYIGRQMDEATACMKFALERP